MGMNGRVGGAVAFGTVPQCLKEQFSSIQSSCVASQGCSKVQIPTLHDTKPDCERNVPTDQRCLRAIEHDGRCDESSQERLGSRLKRGPWTTKSAASRGHGSPSRVGDTSESHKRY